MRQTEAQLRMCGEIADSLNTEPLRLAVQHRERVSVLEAKRDCDPEPEGTEPAVERVEVRGFGL